MKQLTYKYLDKECKKILREKIKIIRALERQKLSLREDLEMCNEDGDGKNKLIEELNEDIIKLTNELIKEKKKYDLKNRKNIIQAGDITTYRDTISVYKRENSDLKMKLKTLNEKKEEMHDRLFTEHKKRFNLLKQMDTPKYKGKGKGKSKGKSKGKKHGRKRTIKHRRKRTVKRIRKKQKNKSKKTKHNK